jgi:hypothetical protein
MKKAFLLIAILGLTISMHAQVSKTMSVVPGGLYKALTDGEKKTITNLILTGSVDARDFKTMRDAMPVLSVIDLSRATIVEFSGEKGTVRDGKKATYKANVIPQFAFFNEKNITGKQVLTQIIFPKNLGGIGEKAFWSCYGLTETTIPQTVISIGEQAYYKCKSITAITVYNSKPISDLGKGVFFAVDPSTCILHVPEGSKDAYQGAKQWGDFINIQDDVVIKAAGE